jgi:predicted acyl esterase
MAAAQPHVQTWLTRNSSLYVTAEDGTRIAIDISLPENLRAEQRHAR